MKDFKIFLNESLDKPYEYKQVMYAIDNYYDLILETFTKGS